MPVYKVAVFLLLAGMVGPLPNAQALIGVGLLIARFGVVEVAANQIALNFSSLVFMVPLSIGIALTTRVGQALGLTLVAEQNMQPETLARAGEGDAAAMIEAALGIELEETYLVGTGYGRVTLPFSKEHIRSEILCHGLGAHMMYPGTRTVLDIGGQDTKGIQIDGAGIVANFQMNDRCAAGCGRYLGYIADEMNMGLHELGPLAMQSNRPARINSTCTVFAGAELRERACREPERHDRKAVDVLGLFHILAEPRAAGGHHAA